MALTEEQQAQVDIQIAIQKAEEERRQAYEIVVELRRIKLESVRLAKETLIENARSKPVDNRDVTAEEIATFAQSLVAYVDA